MIEIKVPDLAESITEGTISRWLKKVGEQVHAGEPVMELETDKVNLEVNADQDGVLQEILKQPGDTVQVGEVIAVMKEGSDSQVPAAEAPATRAPSAPAPSKNEEKSSAITESEPIVQADPANKSIPLATPAARKLAREQGLDLHKIRSADPIGRLSAADIRASETQPSRNQAQPPKVQGQKKEQNGVLPVLDTVKPVERIHMSRRRQTIANRLVEAQHTAAMLTTFNEVDMTAILDVRRRRKDAFLEKHKVKLGFMSFFTKAVVGALKDFPLLNAEIQGDEILMKKYYDIGIAVSAAEGLVVPVVRDADRLGFAEIERQIAELAQKARNNALRLEDLLGGTFTITNGGVFGSLLSTPILNAPQVGILGMHKIQWRPIAIDEKRMENRPMMYIAISYDHRIVDGAEAVSFLVKVKELLEDPESLLLEG